MDDLMSKIQSVLSDPESMKQIQELAGMLTSGDIPGEDRAPSNAAPQGANADPAPFAQLVSNLNGGGQAASQNNGMPELSQLLSGLGLSGGPQQPPAAQSGSGFDISKLMQLQGIMAQANRPNKNVELLMALRPLMKEENQVKIDRIIKIFKLLAIYPALKESGLLGGDLFGLL